MATPECRAACRKRNAERHIAKGLCRQCSEEAVEGLQRCEKHLKLNNMSSKAWRDSFNTGGTKNA